MVRLRNELETSSPSSDQKPFCDMSHKGTEFRPLRFYLQDAKQDIQLCGCKLSTKAPFCDGLTCHKLKEGVPAAQILETRIELSKQSRAAQLQEDSKGSTPN